MTYYLLSIFEIAETRFGKYVYVFKCGTKLVVVISIRIFSEVHTVPAVNCKLLLAASKLKDPSDRCVKLSGLSRNGSCTRLRVSFKSHTGHTAISFVQFPDVAKFQLLLRVLQEGFHTPVIDL